jgi:hypothetical protein
LRIICDNKSKLKNKDRKTDEYKTLRSFTYIKCDLEVENNGDQYDSYWVDRSRDRQDMLDENSFSD